MAHMYIESYGVRLDIEVEDDELVPQVQAILPPGWQASDDFPEDGHLTLARNPGGGYDVLLDGASMAEAVGADIGVHILDAQLRGRIALASPTGVFIHAGVVAVDGSALLLPAASFAGKSTLVAALIELGAAYFSDEFAVLDEQGRVHPYPKSLSLRKERNRYGTRMAVEEIGGTAGTEPARVGVIAITRYLPGTRWEPAVRDSGVGALALMTHAVAARERPDQTLAAVSQAAESATVLEGDRGEAGETAELLLAQLRAA
jgi:hypothetical protein